MSSSCRAKASWWIRPMIRARSATGLAAHCLWATRARANASSTSASVEIG